MKYHITGISFEMLLYCVQISITVSSHYMKHAQHTFILLNTNYLGKYLMIAQSNNTVVLLNM